MAAFSPSPSQSLTFKVRGRELVFQPVGLSFDPTIAFESEGAKAIVYKLAQAGDRLYALKCMKHKFREPGLAKVCASLENLKDVPGLRVCDRLCLDRTNAVDVIAQWPELEYSIIMPWMVGVTWADVRASNGQRWSDGTNGSNERARLELAADFVGKLAFMETHGFAHCDLSPGNVVFDAKTRLCELIDVEDVFGPPPIVRPSIPSRASDGYRHAEVGTMAEPWNANSDRFAAAVLVAEILTIHDPAVQAKSAGVDSYFLGAQTKAHDARDPAFREMVAGLRRVSAGAEFARLFEAAWAAKSLKECPSLRDWDAVLSPFRSSATADLLSAAPPPKVKSRFGELSPFIKSLLAGADDAPKVTEFNPIAHEGPRVSTGSPASLWDSPPKVGGFIPIGSGPPTVQFSPISGNQAPPLAPVQPLQPPQPQVGALQPVANQPPPVAINPFGDDEGEIEPVPPGGSL